MNRLLTATSKLLGLCILVLAAQRTTFAQTVTAVPKLDFNHFTGSWYEIARLPNKREKKCADNVVEVIALGDKSRQLQIVNSCKTTKGFIDVRNATARSKKNHGDGELKVTYLFPFSEKNWVLAVAPEWLLIGSPNHKSLWIYSKTTTMSPETLAEIEQKAAAQGFATAKLVMTRQSGH